MRRCPPAPGWTVRDLIVHTGLVHRHKTDTVRGGYLTEAAPQPHAPHDDVLDWFTAGVDEMLAVFSAADLSLPTWTWCGHDHTAAWWVRRMAHEKVVRAADASLAVGRVLTIEASLALDGVDEILDQMMVGGPPWGAVTPGDRTVRLKAGGRRRALLTASFAGTSPITGHIYEDVHTLVYDEETGPADTVVRTDSETLDLWLWGRRALPDGAVGGDGSLARYVRSVAEEATQ